MTAFAAIKRLNPELPLYSVLDPVFARYGRVLEVPDGKDLIRKLAATPLPETGNSYQASDELLEKTDTVKAFAATVFGGMELQAGFCNGFGHTMNAMEYHKCSEVNVSPTGLVLLLALPEQLSDGTLNSADVVGFYLPKNVYVEVYAFVLHFAPCRVTKKGFKCLIGLEKHTNEPLPSVDTAAPGEQKLLWARNKWLTCHPDSPQAADGAYVGIVGENIELRLPEGY